MTEVQANFINRTCFNLDHMNVASDDKRDEFNVFEKAKKRYRV